MEYSLECTMRIKTGYLLLTVIWCSVIVVHGQISDCTARNATFARVVEDDCLYYDCTTNTRRPCPDGTSVPFNYTDTEGMPPCSEIEDTCFLCKFPGSYPSSTEWYLGRLITGGMTAYITQTFNETAMSLSTKIPKMVDLVTLEFWCMDSMVDGDTVYTVRLQALEGNSSLIYQCIENRFASQNIVLQKQVQYTSSIKPSAEECNQNILPTTPWYKVLIPFPEGGMAMDPPVMKCPLPEGVYQVIVDVDDTLTRLCEDDPQSVAVISSTEVYLDICDEFPGPSVRRFTCDYDISDTVLDRAGQGNFLIVSKEDGPPHRAFYCVRYKVEGDKLYLSMVKKTNNTLECASTSTHKSYGKFADGMEIPAVALEMAEMQCAGNITYARVPEEECLYYGCQSPDVTWSKLACPVGTAVPDTYTVGADDPCTVPDSNCFICEFPADYHSKLWIQGILYGSTTFYFTQSFTNSSIYLTLKSIFTTVTEFWCVDSMADGDAVYTVKLQAITPDKQELVYQCTENRFIRNRLVLQKQAQFTAPTKPKMDECVSLLQATPWYAVMPEFPEGTVDYKPEVMRCPFPEGVYQLTMNTNSCVDRLDSVAIVSETGIYMEVCDEYGSIIRDFSCNEQISAVEFGEPDDSKGDIVILSQIHRSWPQQRIYYCTRYKVEGDKIHLSMMKRTEHTLDCASTSNYSMSGPFEENMVTPAVYIELTAIECADNVTNTRIPEDECLYYGCQSPDVTWSKLTCPVGTAVPDTYTLGADDPCTVTGSNCFMCEFPVEYTDRLWIQEMLYGVPTYYLTQSFTNSSVYLSSEAANTTVTEFWCVDSMADGDAVYTVKLQAITPDKQELVYQCTENRFIRNRLVLQKQTQFTAPTKPSIDECVSLLQATPWYSVLPEIPEGTVDYITEKIRCPFPEGVYQLTMNETIGLNRLDSVAIVSDTGMYIKISHDDWTLERYFSCEEQISASEIGEPDNSRGDFVIMSQIYQGWSPPQRINYCYRYKVEGGNIHLSMTKKGLNTLDCATTTNYSTYGRFEEDMLAAAIYFKLTAMDCDDNVTHARAPEEECLYYGCQSPEVTWSKLQCSPGTSVPDAYTLGMDNPCTVMGSSCFMCEFPVEYTERLWIQEMLYGVPTYYLTQSFTNSSVYLSSEAANTTVTEFWCVDSMADGDAVYTVKLQAITPDKQELVYQCTENRFIRNRLVLQKQTQFTSPTKPSMDECVSLLQATPWYSVLPEIPEGKVDYITEKIRCPFPEGVYQLTLNETIGVNRLDSVAIVSDTGMYIKISHDDITLERYFNCEEQIFASEIGEPDNSKGDFVIMSQMYPGWSPPQRINYCYRYKVEGENIHLSMTKKALNTLDCATTTNYSTYGHFEEDMWAAAIYFKLTAMDCADNVTNARVSEEECLYYGCQSPEVTWSKLQCSPGTSVPDAYTLGMDNPCTVKDSNCFMCGFPVEYTERLWIQEMLYGVPTYYLTQSFTNSSVYLSSENANTTVTEFWCVDSMTDGDAVYTVRLQAITPDKQELVYQCTENRFIRNRVVLQKQTQFTAPTKPSKDECVSLLQATPWYSVLPEIPEGTVDYITEKIKCPFPEGVYQLTLNETIGLNRLDSVAIVSETGMYIKSVHDDRILYERYFSCEEQISASEIGETDNSKGDFVIMSQMYQGWSPPQRINYCYRYKVEGEKIHLSMTKKAVNTLDCATTTNYSTYGRFEEDMRWAAIYFKLTAMDCADNVTYARVPEDECLYYGCQSPDVTWSKLQCPPGTSVPDTYTLGMDNPCTVMDSNCSIVTTTADMASTETSGPSTTADRPLTTASTTVNLTTTSTIATTSTTNPTTTRVATRSSTTTTTTATTTTTTTTSAPDSKTTDSPEEDDDFTIVIIATITSVIAVFLLATLAACFAMHLRSKSSLPQKPSWLRDTESERTGYTTLQSSGAESTIDPGRASMINPSSFTSQAVDQYM